MPEILFIVVPCYNEEAVLPETASRLLAKLHSLIDAGKVLDESRIVFVDDGSKDKTAQLIQDLNRQDPHFGGVFLSRNKGHQNALLAGLMTAKDFADFTISMDADLQDDIEAVDRMIGEYQAGNDIVYGVRDNRDNDTFSKRATAQGFYQFMTFLGVDSVYNHADYRLMSKRAVEALSEFREVNLFLRGIVPLIGFQSAIVTYKRGERFAGESKYPLKKMLAFAVEGITSFSIRPIRFVTLLGIVIFIVSIVMLISFIIQWRMGATIQGWASTIVSIWAIGGLQLLAIGIIGEYIGKAYLEVKNRPKYIIDKVLLR